MREVPLGSIDGICKGISATFAYVERKFITLDSPFIAFMAWKSRILNHFGFFNRCNCRETEKRNREDFC